MRTAAITSFILFLIAAPAQASCPSAPSVAERIANAPVVFVGTVTGVEDDGHAAAVRVEATWKGQELPQQVAITSEGSGSGLLGTPGRVWRVDQRYLFFPTNSASPFRDATCSGTRIYTSDLDRYAPPGGIPSGSPSPGPPRTSSGPGSFLAIAVFIALAAAALNQVRRMRRAPVPVWHDTTEPRDDPDLRR